MATYQVLMTNMAGVPVGEPANVSVDSITWELNAPGEATLRIPVNEADAWTYFAPSLQTRIEVQIWRNGTLIWWGIYVAGTADETTLTITCYGLLWYLTRRYFGPVHSSAAALPKKLTNGDFEHTTVTTGWTTSAGVTTAGSTSRRRTGTKAIKLTTTAGVDGDYYIGQGVSTPTPARVRPLTWTLSGRLYIESITTPDFYNRALSISSSSATGTFDLLKPDDPHGVWMHREATYTIPASATPTMTAALYAPSAGVVYWDDVRLTYEMRTGAIEGEDWSDSYLRRIFNYGAGNSLGGTEGTPLWWGGLILKGSLNMAFAGTGGPAAGSLPADLYWDHADEGNIFAAMAELPARNVLDFEVTWATNGRSRSLTSWTPRKGSTKLGLAAEDGRNIVAFRYDVDGRRRASDVRVSGRSTGKVREEGQAGGPSVADGFQLESIISPAFELTGQPLIDLSTSELARLSEPVKTPTVTVAASVFMGDTAEAGAPLVVGDTIPVRKVTTGWVRESANRRVVKMTLRPANETLDLLFNES